MRTSHIAAAVSIALALAGLLAACDKTPTTPTPPTAFPTRIEIVGPTSVPPGGTGQFSVTAHLANGSSRDVTNEVQWSSTNRQVLSIAATGLATGLQPGDTSISAQLTAQRDPLRATREVIVVPAGTYRLVGLVTETDESGPVVDARVEVTGGPAAGLFTASGGDGRYRLYGVSGNSQIQVTKDGYQTHLQTASITDHQILNMQLALLAPRPNLSGTYALAVLAADECRGRLPDDAMFRGYFATLTQQGSQLDVSLSGATFALNRNGKGSRLRGRLEPGRAIFSLSAYDPYYYHYGDAYYADLVEQLPNGTYLVVSGTVVATLTARVLSGILNGSINIYPRDIRSLPTPAPTATCRSTAHRFTFSG